MMITDMELVRQYAGHHSESAFEALVSRHINLVYSAALRQVRDPQLAQEITQAVFIILARKAGSLSPKTILSGWLYRTTRYTAANVLRSEAGRHRREQEAHMQSNIDPSPSESAWCELSPLLDEAMERLGQTDRNAIILRYFENKSLQEVGTALGMQERAAQKRVSRSLEKLRAFFNKRGVVLSGTAVAAALTANSVHAAPAGLSGIVTTSAITQGATAGTSSLALAKGALKLMAWSKVKTAVVAGIAVLFATGTAVTVQRHFAGPSWEMTMENLNSLPPTLILRSTQFKKNGGMINGNTHKALLENTWLQGIVTHAYDIPLERIIFPQGFPRWQNYDLMLTLNDHPREALQKEIQRQLGYVGRREMREKDIFLLRVKYPYRPGLKLAGMLGGTGGSGDGHYGMVNEPVSTLAKYLQGYVGKAVIDDTGLTNRYDIAFDWKTTDELKQTLLDDLGLELVPSRDSVEMLIVERAK